MQARSSLNSRQSNRTGRPSSRTMLARCRSPWQRRTSPAARRASSSAAAPVQHGRGRAVEPGHRVGAASTAGQGSRGRRALPSTTARMRGQPRPCPAAARPRRGRRPRSRASPSTRRRSARRGRRPESSWSSAGKRRISSSHSTGSPGPAEGQATAGSRVTGSTRAVELRRRAPVQRQLVPATPPRGAPGSRSRGS